MSETEYRRRLEELRAEQRRASEELSRASDELYRLAAPHGAADHTHGEGTYKNPARWHAHPYLNEDHEHPPGSAEDAPWPDSD